MLSNEGEREVTNFPDFPALGKLIMKEEPINSYISQNKTKLMVMCSFCYPIKT